MKIIARPLAVVSASLLFSFICANLANAQTTPAQPLEPACLERRQLGHDAVLTSVAYDSAKRKIYAGVHASSVSPRSLVVFDTDAKGQALGQPRRYAAHPESLPVSASYNDVQDIALATRFRKLYLGFTAPFYNQSLNSLVVYDLDASGEPVGHPKAYDTGAPIAGTTAIAVHPRLNLLYAISRRAAGVSAVPLDANGNPTGTATLHKVGDAGKIAFSLRADGSRLYLLTLSGKLEVLDLDAKGEFVGEARTFATTNLIAADPNKTSMAITNVGAYFKNPDGTATYYQLDEKGEPVGELKTTTLSVQQVARGSSPGTLLVASDVGFHDALSGKWIVNGSRVQEYSLSPSGAPEKIIRESKAYLRHTPLLLHNQNAPLLASHFMGSHFLGNRFKDLRLRVTLSDLKASTPLVPVVRNFKVEDKGTWLYHTYSPKYDRVYSSGENIIHTYSIKKGSDQEVITLPCPGATAATRAIAVDDARGVLYVGRKDGTIAVRPLDADGVPSATGESLRSGIDPMMLAVHPTKGVVYALGVAIAGQTADARVVPIAIERNPTYARGMALDAERGRIYVAGSFLDGGLAVWKLDDNGRLSTPGPSYYSEALTEDKGLLTTVRVDSKRRKLYAAGYSLDKPDGAKGKRGIAVFDLDANGDPVAAARSYLRNDAGEPHALALAPNGQWLYMGGSEHKLTAWRLNHAGEPQGPPQLWPISTGRVQLTASADGTVLIGSTMPSTFENLLLTPAGDPIVGVNAQLEFMREKLPLGILRDGVASEWIDPEAALKDVADPPVLYLQLLGADITQAHVKFEVVLQRDNVMQPVKTVSNDIVGNRDALFLPPYGIDTLEELPSFVQTSTDRFRQYFDWAQKYAIKPEERPRQFVIANSLNGMDDSVTSLDLGLKTLAATGSNTIGLSRWYDIPPQQQRATASSNGFHRFASGTYAPPSYFSFLTEEMQPALLDKWAAEFKPNIDKMGAKPSELALFHLADEPGWYFPGRLIEVRSDPKKLAVFHDYLRSKGFAPEFFGKSSWEQVVPIGLSGAVDLPSKRLFYWTTRFYPESMSLGLAAATAALQRQFHPGVLTTANLANRQGLSFYPSPGKPYGNSTDTSQDSAGAAPDWFDLARKKATSCMWTEDWFSDHNAMEWSFLGDLLRCSAREGDIEFGSYVVGKTTGDLANNEGGKYKIMSLAGQGAKAISLYTFGPWRVFGDGYSDAEAPYESFAKALRLLGKSEKLTYPGRPKDGTVAILLPTASQTWAWTPEQQYFFANDIWGYHSALTHEQYPVDIVDDVGLETGSLDKYKYSMLYVTAPQLSVKAQQAILKWVEAGGTLVLSPGACLADEYNEPTQVLSAMTGATPAQQTAPDAPVRREQPAAIQVTDSRLGVKAITTSFRIEPLNASSGKALASFTDGKAALVAATKGKGRILSFGYWPGLTYWHSADRTNITELPKNFSADARSLITAAARFANAKKHVEVSVDGVEARLLESAKGIAVTLLNWTGEPLNEIVVTLPTMGKFSQVESVETGALTPQATPQGLSVKLPLSSVDVLMLSR